LGMPFTGAEIRKRDQYSLGETAGDFP
jgi:hypothetical protein